MERKGVDGLSMKESAAVLDAIVDLGEKHPGEDSEEQKLQARANVLAKVRADRARRATAVAEARAEAPAEAHKHTQSA